MLDDTEREQEPAPAPPTVEQLTAELKRARIYADLFRQQRDRAVALANDLQADLAVCREELAEARGDKESPAA